MACGLDLSAGARRLLIAVGMAPSQDVEPAWNLLQKRSNRQREPPHAAVLPGNRVGVDGDGRRPQGSGYCRPALVAERRDDEWKRVRGHAKRPVGDASSATRDPTWDMAVVGFRIESAANPVLLQRDPIGNTNRRVQPLFVVTG